MFEAGTLVLAGSNKEQPVPPAWVWDARRGAFRAPALSYAETILWLRKNDIAYVDEARQYERRASGKIKRQPPFPYQREALQAWGAEASRG